MGSEREQSGNGEVMRVASIPAARLEPDKMPCASWSAGTIERVDQSKVVHMHFQRVPQAKLTGMTSIQNNIRRVFREI